MNEALGTRKGSRKGQQFAPNAPLASPAFNPLSLITGAGGFWRADIGVTGSPSVTQWNDQSSFANNMTVGTNQTSPTFSSTGFNSAKPGITFADNTSAGLGCVLTFAATTTLSVFQLLQMASASGGGNDRFNSLVGNGQANDFGNTASYTLYAPSSFHWGCLNNSVEIGNGGSAVAVSSNGLFLIGQVFNGANGNKWQNGTVQGSGTGDTNTFGGAGTNTFTIGEARFAATEAAGCITAFIGLTQKAMTSTDWTNLKNWSNANWGTSF